MPYPFYQANKNSGTDYFDIYVVNNISFPPHLHSHVELIYIVEGTLTLSINEHIKNLQKGDIAVSFPNDVHSFTTNSSSKAILLLFSTEIISGYFGKKLNATFVNPFIDTTDINETTISLINLLFDEFFHSNNKYVVKGFLYSIFGKLNSHFTFEDSKHCYNNTIQSLLKYIESHYCENITLELIAKDLGYSKFHLSRLFTNKIGYQFNDYINRLRTNMAQRLLIETDMAILNIALECGFQSNRNFNRVFKEFTGFTPTGFRRQNI